MKILKRIALVLGVLVGIWLILALFAPSNVRVERTTMINAPSAIVFDQVNTLQHWKAWSYWDNIDKTTMKDSFAGPASGVGAVHYWDSPNDSVGKGSLTITKSEPNAFVETALNFDGMGTSMGGWRMKDTAGLVMVTTYMDMEPPFLMRPMMLFMNMDKMLGPDFEKSLAGLKFASESIAASANNSVSIKEVTTEPMKIMSIMDSCTSADIAQKFGSWYAEIGAAVMKQGLKQAGPVFAVYHKVTPNADGSYKFVVQAGVPVDKAGKTDGRVKYWEVPPTKAIKADHYGSYQTTEETGKQIVSWMQKNGKTQDGAYWEVYVTDPMMEKDSTKWLTEVYYPVK
jgi:effector-binding domain-containing protein